MTARGPPVLCAALPHSRSVRHTVQALLTAQGYCKLSMDSYTFRCICEACTFRFITATVYGGKIDEGRSESPRRFQPEATLDTFGENWSCIARNGQCTNIGPYMPRTHRVAIHWSITSILFKARGRPVECRVDLLSLGLSMIMRAGAIILLRAPICALSNPNFSR